MGGVWLGWAWAVTSGWELRCPGEGGVVLGAWLAAMV